MGAISSSSAICGRKGALLGIKMVYVRSNATFLEESVLLRSAMLYIREERGSIQKSRGISGRKCLLWGGEGDVSVSKLVFLGANARYL